MTSNKPNKRSTSKKDTAIDQRIIELERQLQQQEHTIAELQQREQIYIQTMDAITDLLLVKGPQSQIMYANKAFCDFYGMTIEQVREMIDAPFNPPDYTQQYLKDDLYVFTTGQTLNIPSEPITRHDGEVFLFNTVKSPILDEHGQVAQLVAVARDITRQQQAEFNLRQSEELFRTMFEEAPIGIVTVGTNYRLLQVNQTFCTLLGYTKQELIDRHVVDITHPEDSERDRNLALQLFQGAVSKYKIQKRFVTKTEEILWAELTAAAICAPDGSVRYGLGMVENITERRQAELALREAKEEAERANYAKSEFLSRMSHELRTPMNAILGFAQLLELDQLTPAQSESTQHILKGGRHLLSLINEVLDIARIEAGHMALSIEPVDINIVLQECLTLMSPIANQWSIKLSAARLQTAHSHVLADQQRLKQVLLNLLSNAIKYTPQAGSVTLSCEEREPNQLRISISDTGKGIAPDYISRLFTPFDRLDAERSGIEGTGLGLVLSKRLVEAMGGQIGVESILDHGTTFWITLPYTESPLLQDHGLADTADQLDSALKGQVILYIEDNLSNLRLIERLIERRSKVTLLAAMQGILGYELARQQQPDLILLDVHLPDIAGDALLQRLREDPLTSSIPVVVISADATARQRERLLAAGAHAYLTKPLHVAEFFKTIDEILGERHL